jgi:hypothetical protein
MAGQLAAPATEIQDMATGGDTVTDGVSEQG